MLSACLFQSYINLRMESRKRVTRWRRTYTGFVYIHTGEGKLQTLSKLIKIRFDRGRLPEDLDCRQEERNQKDQTGQVT